MAVVAACHAAAEAETVAVTMDRAATVVVTDAVKETNFELNMERPAVQAVGPFSFLNYLKKNLVMVEERPFMAVK